MVAATASAKNIDFVYLLEYVSPRQLLCEERLMKGNDDKCLKVKGKLMRCMWY